MRGHVRIGISGWRYDGWRGPFYPDDLVQRRELEYASRKLASIELNGSFYSLQRPESYARWREETPDGFVFSVKAPKFITHVRKLRDVEGPVANFFASGLLALGPKLGPILWQFAPSFGYDAALVEPFLAILPKTVEDAVAIARRHDGWMTERAHLETDARGSVRHAIEIRNASFANEEFVAMLAHHGVALVVADTAGKWPLLEDVTADFLYLRLHGDEVLYESGYTDAALARWAARIERWADGEEPDDAHRMRGPAKSPGARDVYCYFDNDVKARAPADAQRLAARLGVAWQVPFDDRTERPAKVKVATGEVATPSTTRARVAKAESTRTSARSAAPKRSPASKEPRRRAKPPTKNERRTTGSVTREQRPTSDARKSS